ncbi:MAG: hypothetical protein R2695_01805 [Acidimicrobiales bacterium]
MIATVLLLAGCGSDGDGDTTPTTPSTVPATAPVSIPTTEPTTTPAPTVPVDTADPSSTSTVEPTVTGATLLDGSASSASGATVTWSLVGDTAQLCFVADATTADATAISLPTVKDCLRPGGGIADLDEDLSVSVGSLGDRSFGYVWGRVRAKVTSLVILHADGASTTIQPTTGPDGVKVFAAVVDIDATAEVRTLEARGSSGVITSENIRGFLRSGPTYPTIPPTTTADLDPTAG